MTAQRQFPRYALEATATLTVGDQTVSGRTANLSRGGACAMVPVFIPVGARIEVELMLVFGPDQYSEPLRLPCRVVWCTAVEAQFQIGLAFGSLRAEAAKYLDLFLKYLDEGAAERRATGTAGRARDPFA